MNHVGTSVRSDERRGGAPASAVEARLGTAWLVLRVGLGLGAFLAGLDKFFDVLATWSMYLSPLAERLLPISDNAFLRCAGVAEMLVGLAILTRWTRVGAYLLSAWLLAIVVNLAIASHFWDLALRDLEIALSAFTLGRLTEWRTAHLPLADPSKRVGHPLHGRLAA